MCKFSKKKSHRTQARDCLKPQDTIGKSFNKGLAQKFWGGKTFLKQSTTMCQATVPEMYKLLRSSVKSSK